MYSCEIDGLMKQYKFVLPSNKYIQMCQTSPQLNHIIYDCFSDTYKMWDIDGNNWNFKVVLENN